MSLDTLPTIAPEPLYSPPVRPQRPRLRRWLRRIGRSLLVVFVLATAAMGTQFGWDTIRSQRKKACETGLKTIGHAFHKYQDANGVFPKPAINDASGRPLLSWRVAILPYLPGGEALHREFHLDEPWDSPHNLRLVKRMPAVFGCPSDPSRTEGKTPYRVLMTGHERETANPMFEAGRGVEMMDVTDGTSNTILVVETPDSIPWTQPDGLRFEPGIAPPRLGGRHLNGFHALMVDASVRTLKYTIAPNVLMLLITRDGLEVTA